MIALQEVAEPEQLSTLNDLLAGRYRYHAFARGFRTDRYVGFLSEIPFEEEIPVETSVGRDALAVTVDVPSQGIVTLVNCHADAFNARRRRFFVNDIIDWHRSSGTQSVILAGDFNLDLAPVESSDLFTDDRRMTVNPIVSSSRTSAIWAGTVDPPALLTGGSTISSSLPRTWRQLSSKCCTANSSGKWTIIPC